MKRTTSIALWLEAIIWGGYKNIPPDTKRKIIKNHETSYNVETIKKQKKKTR